VLNIDSNIVGMWFASEMIYEENGVDSVLTMYDFDFPMYDLELKSNGDFEEIDPDDITTRGKWSVDNGSIILNGEEWVEYERTTQGLYFYCDNWYGFRDCVILMELDERK
jgi:hypothetical protein